MESIPVYPGTRQSDFSRFSSFAIKDFPELTILTLAGDTTDKILQFVASVERFIRAYNRKIKMRFTVVAAEMAQYYMLDPLKSGSEQTMLTAERYNNEVQTIPERFQSATDLPLMSTVRLYSCLSKALRIPEFQLYLHLQFSKAKPRHQ